MLELVFAPLEPDLSVSAADPSQQVTLDFALAFKGDPGIVGLDYFSIQDANGVEVARVLTGDIQ